MRKRKERQFAINGNGLTKPITGMERYLLEIVPALDQICKGMDIVLVLPKTAVCPLKLKNIRVVHCGFFKGELWGQISFTKYLYQNKAIGVELGSRISLLKPDGIVCLHDIKNSTEKDVIKFSIRYLSILKNYITCKFAKHIVTVSEYSKNEIIKVYKVNPDRITIIHNAWQHIKNYENSEEIFDRHPYIKRGEYFFSLGSLSIHKNIKWIIDNAKKYPDNMYIISGRVNKDLYGTSDDLEEIENIKYVGYASNADVKALMRHCKALVLPSLFEGFGIPPLEALSLGAKAVISDITCLPEIFEDCVHYIDPYNPDVDLNKLLEEPVAPPDKLLEKYNWDKSARQWLEVMKKYSN